jgi:3-oxoacid CoA-transferase subunit B
VQRIITDLAVIDVVDPAPVRWHPRARSVSARSNWSSSPPVVTEDEVREKTQPDFV